MVDCCLKCLGVDGLVAQCIGNWLHDRKQRVVTNGKCIKCSDVICGVPQGSALGPTLFINAV